MKIGDRVKVISEDSYLKGQEGVIKKDNEELGGFGVLLDEDTNWNVTLHFEADELELIV